MMTLFFDRTNPNWINDPDGNEYLIRVEEQYLNDLFRANGYIYVSTVYKTLGFEFNPYDPDKMYKKDDCERIELQQTRVEIKDETDEYNHAVIIKINFKRKES